MKKLKGAINEIPPILILLLLTLAILGIGLLWLSISNQNIQKIGSQDFTQTLINIIAGGKK